MRGKTMRINAKCIMVFSRMLQLKRIKWKWREEILREILIIMITDVNLAVKEETFTIGNNNNEKRKYNE